MPLTRRAGATRAAIINYTMAARAQRAYFGIHNQSNCLPNPVPHRHEYFQIYVNTRGETMHYIGGAQRPIGPGTLSFVLPFLVHYIPNTADGVFHVINISKDYLLPSLDLDVFELSEVPLARAPELAPFRFQHCLDFRFDETETQYLHELCERMAQEAQQPSGEDTASHLLIRSHLLNLIGMVWRSYGDEFRLCESQGKVLQSYKPAVLRCIRYITQNLSQELILGDAAQASHVSATHLAHLLKNETGKTFLELVTERRIEQAKTLLVFTSDSAAEIGESTGFGEPAHFARRFRQIVGSTPTAYRRRFQQEGMQTWVE
ncbi:AraC family transcriptional regulator [Cupriavidus basilensis]|uniref:AraC family transcriptional regulator n=1 Tax=Cupriavidus basilensis TaxID=68895 RepID=A0ABT6B045_9BURK|nr:AraC family transcriptional regulator [Cupriavidus basilensis]MDF3837852.1 AraC family transcriptional regulator [Cupriavidus basilensis]